MESKQIQYVLQDLDSIALSLFPLIQKKQIVTLTGSLGAGKTTFTRALLRHFGVKSPVTSPTFTYMNVYEADNGKKIYHFDLYRIQSLEEFEQLGLAEYLHMPHSLCLIEWPEVIMDLLNQDHTVHIRFEPLDDEKERKIIIEYRGNDEL